MVLPLFQQLAIQAAMEGRTPPLRSTPGTAPVAPAQPVVPPASNAAPPSADPNVTSPINPGLAGLAEAAAAVNTPEQPGALPPVNPGVPAPGGSLDPGIMSVLVRLLQGPTPPDIPTLGSLIQGR